MKFCGKCGRRHSSEKCEYGATAEPEIVCFAETDLERFKAEAAEQSARDAATITALRAQLERAQQAIVEVASQNEQLLAERRVA